jgi:hypothetical protein
MGQDFKFEFVSDIPPPPFSLFWMRLLVFSIAALTAIVTNLPIVSFVARIPIRIR